MIGIAESRVSTFTRGGFGKQWADWGKALADFKSDREIHAPVVDQTPDEIKPCENKFLIIFAYLRRYLWASLAGA